MPNVSAALEVESEVYQPSNWLVLAVGTLFLAIGVIGFVALENGALADVPPWIARCGASLFAAVGAVSLIWALRNQAWPAHVLHASPDAVPDISPEPVLEEGSIVHGRLTHELFEDALGWRFQPATSLWRNDKRLIFGFGIPFMIVFAGGLSWVFHHHEGLSWPAAIAFATAATTASGGTALAFITLAIRSSYRRLCRLIIPSDGDDLQVDTPRQPKLSHADRTAGLKGLFFDDDNRLRLAIPRALVAAVQLCPWRYSTTSTTTWAVQGLLVLKTPDEPGYERIPILLTSDFAGAAKIFARLAGILHVPYLFHGDAAGWQAETARAKTRRPLRSGGML